MKEKLIAMLLSQVSYCRVEKFGRDVRVRYVCIGEGLVWNGRNRKWDLFSKI